MDADMFPPNQQQHIATATDLTSPKISTPTCSHTLVPLIAILQPRLHESPPMLEQINAAYPNNTKINNKPTRHCDIVWFSSMGCQYSPTDELVGRASGVDFFGCSGVLSDCGGGWYAQPACWWWVGGFGYL